MLTSQSDQQPTSFRFLALGDSYTIGEGVEPSGRWPAQLAGMLRDQGTAIDEPQIIATTGWTTDELAKGIPQASPSGPYDLVSLLIGVNNQYRGRNINEYRDQFTALLLQAISLAGGDTGRVVVLSIPDWGVTPFARGRDRMKIAREIDLFNAANREETERLGVAYVDITPISREAWNDSTLLAPDGLHPSAAMYLEWARLTLPWAVAQLKGRQ